MLTLKANRVNLGHTNFLGVLGGAKPKSYVCPAQNARKCLKIDKSNMAAAAELKCIYVHNLSFWLNKVKKKVKVVFI